MEKEKRCLSQDVCKEVFSVQVESPEEDLLIFCTMGANAICTDHKGTLLRRKDKKCINKEERVRHLPGYCP